MERRNNIIMNLEDRRAGRQEGRLVNKNSFSETSQEQLNDKNLSTFQLFNLSTDNGLPPTLQPSKNPAFTLSEVLITLAVIGVVAAMTLPSVIQHFKEQRTVAQLSKTYSVLSQAWQRMEQEYGTIDTWGLTNTSTDKTDSEGNTITNNSAQLLVAERLKPYLKVMKSCEVGKVCYKGGTYSLSGYQITPENYLQNEAAPARFFLSDGSLILIGWWSSGKMDINIRLKPNEKGVYGENIFFFNGYPNKIIPEGSQTGNAFSFSNCKKTKSGKDAGRGCTAWVLYNKNMDYLHCNDLSWNGKTTCK